MSDFDIKIPFLQIIPDKGEEVWHLPNLQYIRDFEDLHKEEDYSNIPGFASICTKGVGGKLFKRGGGIVLPTNLTERNNYQTIFRVQRFPMGTIPELVNHLEETGFYKKVCKVCLMRLIAQGLSQEIKAAKLQDLTPYITK